jgi:hypothetical protein
VLALGLLPAGAAEAGFAPTAETIFEAEQTVSPDLASDAAGNSLIVWSQEKVLGDPQEVKARRLSAGGTLGPGFDVAPGEIATQPSVAVTAAGRAFVAWQSRPEESGPDSVKGRWVEPDGTMGPVLTLVVGKAGEVDAGEVTVAIDPAGVATVTWINFEGNEVSLRRVGPDGGLGTLLADISGGGGAQFHQTAALPNGSTVVVWRGGGIEMNVVDSALGFGVPLKISVTGAADSPQIAADALGNSLVVWRASMGEDWGAFGQRLGPTGALSGTELAVDPLADDFVNQATVAADSAADFVVNWERQNPKNEKTVLARGVNFDAGFTGPVQTVTESPALASPLAVPALFDSGIGAVAWKTGTGTGTGVLGRQIDRVGLPTAAAQELVAKSSFNRVHVASSPAIGAAAFLAHYPISGSAQGGVVRRFLAPPVCADSGAKVVQGAPILTSIACTGAAIEAAAVVEKPKHGGVGTFDPASLSFVYTPKPGFAGSDSFTYTASNDGGVSNLARVSISVGKDTGKPKIKKLKLLRKGKAGKQRFKLRVVFSEPATAKLTIKRVARVAGKLKLLKIGTVRGKKATRKATLPVKGKLARQVRAGGRFRIVAVATDPAGNRSAAKKLAFRVR